MLLNNKQLDYFAICIALLFSIAVYILSLNAPFIFDDNHMIVNNAFIKNAKYFGLFFKGYVTSYPIPKGMCRPLLMLTFAFNYATSKLNPIGYHIINLLFHFLNAVLLYTLLKTLKKDAPFGLILIITLLFVVHPINTEAVTYISSRSDLMATFFILSGFILYLRERYVFALFVYTLALLTKETGLCLPILIGGYFLLYQTKGIKYIFKNKKIIIFLSSLLIATVAYLFYKNIYFSGIAESRLRSSLSNIILQSWVSFFYLRLFIFPDNLNIFHAYPDIDNIWDINGILPLLGIILIVFLLFLLRKKNKLVSMGIFIYLVGLAPKFYATLRVPVMEHHFYLPGTGVYVVLLALSGSLYRRNRRYFLYTGWGIIALLSVLTIERNCQFNSALMIWKKGTEKEPDHLGNWLNLAVEYKKEGNLKKAKNILSKTLTMPNKDRDWKTGIYINLANIYFMEKKYQKAEKLLKECLKLKPNIARKYQIYNNLGLLYEKMDKYDDMDKYVKEAIKLNPYEESSYQKLARINIQNNKLQEATKYVLKALEINPYDFYSYFLKGKIYEKKNNLKEAEKAYKKSIELKDDWFYSHYALSLIYLKTHNPLFSEEILATIRLNPHFKPAIALLRYIMENARK